VSGERRRRAACKLAGLWAGSMAGIGLVAAPTLFSLLPRPEAGRVAGRLFVTDAYLGLVVGAVLLLLTRQQATAEAGGTGSRFSTNMVLVLAALFCIVAGHFGLQPMMEAARSGAGGASFAVLHGAAAAFFLAKLVLVATLAWRLGRPLRAVRAAEPTSSGS
jgi:hypothetical protein